MNANELRLFNGDCLKEMKNMAENSVDSIVTDPPYGLSFMNKHWDYDVPSEEIWRECWRVLKPGGHLLAFFGTRTYHRGVIRIEDAGFEIRDQIQWLYGSGFPKSMDVSKQIDKQAGATREVVGSKFGLPGYSLKQADESDLYGDGLMNGPKKCAITAPSTDLAKQWQGWGTALKPANEPIVLARKPLEGTVAKNVEKWGCGGLNIDGSRIGTTDNLNGGAYSKTCRKNEFFKNLDSNSGEYVQPDGRWPSNVLMDETAAKMLDEQSGNRRSSGVYDNKGVGTGEGVTYMSQKPTGAMYSDSGGASRFFYVAKASKSERGDGNGHPTVKPIKLMQYLIKLVTPAGGIVLDPFMGSGSTGVAAHKLGFGFIGIEMDWEYFEIAQKRIGAE